MMDPRVPEIAGLILQMEAEMRRLGWWEDNPPSEEALQSTVPFCFDTLAFDQWLQWIFIPKMKHIIENGLKLPATSDIFPLAEEVFREMPENTDRLLTLIKRFDEIISNPPGD